MTEKNKKTHAQISLAQYSPRPAPGHIQSAQVEPQCPSHCHKRLHANAVPSIGLLLCGGNQHQLAVLQLTHGKLCHRLQPRKLARLCLCQKRYRAPHGVIASQLDCGALDKRRDENGGRKLLQEVYWYEGSEAKHLHCAVIVAVLDLCMVGERGNRRGGDVVPLAPTRDGHMIPACDVYKRLRDTQRYAHSLFACSHMFPHTTTTTTPCQTICPAPPVQ